MEIYGWICYVLDRIGHFKMIHITILPMSFCSMSTSFAGRRINLILYCWCRSQTSDWENARNGVLAAELHQFSSLVCALSETL